MNTSNDSLLPGCNNTDLEGPSTTRRSKFDVGTGQKLIFEALANELRGKIYEESHVREWSTNICTKIKNRLVHLGVGEKLVVQVVIAGVGPHLEGFCCKTGCYWDGRRDQSAFGEYTSDNLTAMAVVYCCPKYVA